MNRIASANAVNTQVYGTNWGDDKLQKSLKTGAIRTGIGRLFLCTLLADLCATPQVIWHLTIWTWILHTIAFNIPIHLFPNLARLTHGPSYNGAWSLAAVYCWTLYANPTMEFDLAPEGRPVWLVYLRAFWFHFFPPIAVTIDMMLNKISFQTLYKNFHNWSAGGLDYTYPLGLLTCMGSIVLGLVWEVVNGDPSATYNVTSMSNEQFVLIGKIIGTTAAVLSYFFLLRPAVYSK